MSMVDEFLNKAFIGVFVFAFVCKVWEVITFQKKGWRAESNGPDEIIYREIAIDDERELIIASEVTRIGSPILVYIPSDEDWKQMPQWALNRREEIISRIRQDLGSTNYKFTEMPQTAIQSLSARN